MTIKEFKEKIEKLENLETQIEKLKYFMSGIDSEENAKVTICNRTTGNDITYKFNNRFVRKMAQEQLEIMLYNYNYYIKLLRENGLEITNSFDNK